MIVVLDTNVLGLITHPNSLLEAVHCRSWLTGLLDSGVVVYLPEIADYELRRKLLHIQSFAALQRLDALPPVVPYLHITTPMWRDASQLWADARRAGRLPNTEAELSADVILAAQARSLGSDVVIATKNVRHLAPFADARLWTAI